jgi:hypothetical protein
VRGAGAAADPSRLLRSQLTGAAEIEPANARLRQLQSETLDRGWWRLLWLPPSMTYYEPAGT